MHKSGQYRFDQVEDIRKHAVRFSPFFSKIARVRANVSRAVADAT